MNNSCSAVSGKSHHMFGATRPVAMCAIPKRYYRQIFRGSAQGVLVSSVSARDAVAAEALIQAHGDPVVAVGK